VFGFYVCISLNSLTITCDDHFLANTKASLTVIFENILDFTQLEQVEFSTIVKFSFVSGRYLQKKNSNIEIFKDLCKKLTSSKYLHLNLSFFYLDLILPIVNFFLVPPLRELSFAFQKSL